MDKTEKYINAISEIAQPYAVFMKELEIET
ncbi:hypothetical protein BpHYR1_028595, partial [Brachionus plicatilis]